MHSPSCPSKHGRELRPVLRRMPRRTARAAQRIIYDLFLSPLLSLSNRINPKEKEMMKNKKVVQGTPQGHVAPRRANLTLGANFTRPHANFTPKRRATPRSPQPTEVTPKVTSPFCVQKASIKLAERAKAMAVRREQSEARLALQRASPLTPPRTAIRIFTPQKVGPSKSGSRSSQSVGPAQSVSPSRGSPPPLGPLTRALRWGRPDPILRTGSPQT